MAKGGTGGATVGAGGGVHNPSNRLPPGMLTRLVSFLIIPTDFRTIQTRWAPPSANALPLSDSLLPADDPVVVLPDVQKSVRTNSAVTAATASALPLLVPLSLLLLLLPPLH